jgi:hypothetical protein
MMCRFLHDVFVGAGIMFLLLVAVLYGYWQVLKERQKEK